MKLLLKHAICECGRIGVINKPIAFIPYGTYIIKFHFAQSIVGKKFVKNSQRI